jgi:hypothetical protein
MLVPFPNEGVAVVGTLVVGRELVEAVGGGDVVMPVVDTELLESEEDEVVVPLLKEGVGVMLVVGKGLRESVEDDDVPVTPVKDMELVEPGVEDDVPAVPVMDIELEDCAEEDDMLASLVVIVELDKLAVSEEIEVVLVVFPNGGVTELKELPEDVELKMSEEP